jgi:2-phospho-L-lactate guanylyltransferase
MSLWAVVPVKPLEESKSRLEGTLTRAERSALARTLLEHTLKVLATAKAPPNTAGHGVDRVLVVSRDPTVLELARSLGADALPEDCPPELNASLAYATCYALEHGAGMALALPADLAQVTAEDIRALVKCAAAGPCIVIAPDRRGEGTNALLTRPPGAIPYRFGPGSFALHCQEARQMGLRLEVCRRPGLALDVDLPEDLEYLKDSGSGLRAKSLTTETQRSLRKTVKK